MVPVRGGPGNLPAHARGFLPTVEPRLGSEFTDRAPVGENLSPSSRPGGPTDRRRSADDDIDEELEEQDMVTIRIPTTLRTLTGGASTVDVDGATVGEALSNLDAAHPGFRDRLFDDNGLRRFVNVFLADDDVRYLDGVDTAVSDGAEISIIPAVAGG